VGKSGVVRVFAGGLAALMLLLISGCGGGDDPMTKAEFVKAANKICKQQEEERIEGLMEASRKLGVANGEIPSRKVQEKVTLGAIPAVSKEARRIEELNPPEGDEEQIEAIVEAIDKLAEGVERSPGTTLASGFLFRKVNKLVSGYGLEKCKF
jgi:hypothetical protein